MAIGARQPDIRNQFLLEARMLSIIGGIIGIVVGLLGGFALTQGLGFPFVFSVVAIVIAFSVSAIVGISFGLYPAVRAAKLEHAYWLSAGIDDHKSHRTSFCHHSDFTSSTIYHLLDHRRSFRPLPRYTRFKSRPNSSAADRVAVLLSSN